ncbi:restriction endonuclease subunit S [Psychrobacter cryohalolentis]|uniref:Restriction modification system DNA specificity domain protein n=1 Tax=Psychrobacter cryohalolentis (strain ATCC BAA-1226 / DSM 17306 / VKM B-2378 / K5) TaxID=335284 RepID=Q1QC71_PSYCK|nr:restriction endonuclease subunit S [Psychrobacter cryohalolentis]ABE74732.1 restriction modification system DNA specificity domain protein [Psychrobacter cryohalolentis K5]ASE27344.1 restriction endonuclease subunit S [Psychrobacter cryohalolentis]
MNEVKMPEGYKQTEIGVIPEDWEVKDIGEALTIRHGKDQKQVESTRGQYPIFGTGGQMGWASDFLYDKPSVLIGRKGSINKPRYINVPFWTVDTLFYSQVHNGYDEKFMFYKFCLIDWMNYNEASGVPSLNASTISNVKISVPKKPEQTAIATALSDIDNLIQSLEKLIAKKEAIKTGTMQQILTGKTRLPEFATRDDGSAKELKQTELGQIPEDWEVIEFGKLLKEFRNGYSFSAKDYIKNGTPIITMSQIGLNGSFQYNPNEVKKWDASQFEHLKDFWVKDGDLLIAMTDVTPDKNLIGQMTIAELTHTALLNQRVGLLRLNKDLAQSNYLRYLSSLPLWRTYCKGVASLGVQANIGTKEIKQASVTLPLVEEQTAIATILSDMDAEIQALEGRLEKTKDIKQGMMQQLLTGKVRLV